MSIFEIFGAMGIAVGDIFALVGVIGAALLLLWSLAGKTLRRAPELMWVWGISGTFLAALLFVSMLITGERVTKVGFLIGMSPSVMGGLVALAVALLGLSFALQVSRRPVKTGRSRRVRTP